MRIILEGVDGSGKTTLAHILAHKYGLDICHCTQYDPCDYDFYKHTARKNNVVWDRHTIGELIYPTIFNRKPQIHIEDARIALYTAIQDYGAKVFILTCDLDIIKQRLEARGNEHPLILNNLATIDKLFRLYASAFAIPLIDTTKMTLQDIFNLVEENHV